MQALDQIITLFLLLLIGFGVKRLGIVTEQIHQEISSLVLNVCLPAYIINSMNFQFSPDVLRKSGVLIVISFAVYLATILLSYGVTGLMRVKGQRKDIFQYILVFSNVGFMGYPLVGAFLGQQGVFYTALYNLAFNLLIWTFGVYVLTRGKADANVVPESLWARVAGLMNPSLAAIFIGFALFLFSVKLPEPVFNTLKMVGSVTTPLSMMFIGFILAELDAKEIFTDIQVFLVSGVRLILIPALVWLGLKVCGIRGDIAFVPFIIAAMPAAANTAIQASLYDNDYYLGSKVIFVSTLLSVGTIPLMLLWLH